MQPATDIIKKLGGADVVAGIVGVHRTRVYKWMHPKSNGGTDGLIPSWHIQKLLDYAAREGVDLTAAEFFPLENQKGAA